MEQRDVGQESYEKGQKERVTKGEISKFVKEGKNGLRDNVCQ